MKRTILIIIAVLNIFLSASVYAKNVTDELSHGLLRMHILANSNSKTDQENKILVRDKLIELIDVKEYKNKYEVIRDIKNIEDDLNLFLIEKNIPYGCRVVYQEDKFPYKKYKDISLPNGKYECVKVLLGNGDGENWWCVAYPPLCFSASTFGDMNEKEKDKLKEVLTKDAYGLINESNVEYKIKFKTVELINYLKEGILQFL